MKKQLDIRHISIIDALPNFQTKKEILTVGCGDAFVESKLQEMGYNVTATDYFDKESRENTEYLDKVNYHKSSIFDLSSFPTTGCETVICSEVLEHLPNYQEAFRNLLELTHRRLIVTIPWNISYDVDGPPPEGHCNYWTDRGENPFSNVLPHLKRDEKFKDIREFITFAWPYHVTISKIGTKGLDWMTSSRCYMIVVDKMQMTDFVWKRSQVGHVWQLSQDKETGRLQPWLQPVDGEIAGVPPTRIGPYISYDYQPNLMLFTTSDTVQNKKKWLGTFENEVHETLNQRLLVVEINESTNRETMAGYIENTLNESADLTGVVLALEDEQFEYYGHNTFKNINVPCVFIGSEPEKYSDFYEYTIQKEELTDVFAKKILNEIS